MRGERTRTSGPRARSALPWAVVLLAVVLAVCAVMVVAGLTVETVVVVVTAAGSLGLDLVRRLLAAVRRDGGRR